MQLDDCNCLDAMADWFSSSSVQYYRVFSLLDSSAVGRDRQDLRKGAHTAYQLLKVLAFQIGAGTNRLDDSKC